MTEIKLIIQISFISTELPRYRVRHTYVNSKENKYMLRYEN